MGPEMMNSGSVDMKAIDEYAVAVIEDDDLTSGANATIVQ